MKIACSSYIAPGNTWEEKLTNLSNLGYEGIEIRMIGEPSTHIEQAKMINQAAANSVVKPCSLVRPTAEFLQKLSAETKTSKLEDLKQAAELAALLGVPSLLSVEVGSQPLLSPFVALPELSGDRRKLVVDYLYEADQIAQNAGVNFMLEPLNRYESSFYHRLAEAWSLCQDAESMNLGLLADVFHINIEEADLEEAILAHADRIIHVQLGDNNRLLPGEGQFNFIRFFEALHKAGYQEYMALECIAPQNEFESLKRCAKFLKSNLAVVTGKK